MKKREMILYALLFFFGISQAQTTDVAPDNTGMNLSAQEWCKNVVMGWNLGNSLESSGGETAWGNPKTTQDMIKAVKSAGFNAIRIPVRWTEQLSDQTNMIVKEAWLNRVKEIVDWCLAEDMYVIINTHHEAWLDRSPFYSTQTENNRKLAALWKCIATYFRDYDQRLAFAGTNETVAKVNGQENWGTPTTEWQAVQNSYNQTFINAVRATGGKNYYRHLVVQTYACSGWSGLSGFTIPTDVVEGRLSVEFHDYDPYDYAGGATYYYWGKKYKDMGKRTPNDDETAMKNYFNRIVNTWWKKGLGVVLGEYGATCHYTTDDKQTQMENLQYYYKCMVSEAREHGFAAFAWDNNVFGNGKEIFGIFKRIGGSITVGNEYALKGICEGAGTEYIEPGQHEGGETVVAGDLFWDGDAMMDWGNGLQITIPGNEIERYGKDIMIYLVYTLDFTDYNTIQFFYGDWSKKISFFVNGSSANEQFTPTDIHASSNGDVCVSCITLGEDVYNIAKQKGIVLQGHGVRLNQVVLTNPAGIQGTTVSASTVNGMIYSISGQQTTRPRHGIYIRNNKKYVVK